MCATARSKPAGPPKMSKLPKPNPTAFTYYARLERVKRYVETHLSGDLSVAKVSAIAGMERTYFSNFFHDKTGVRYRDWLASLRIERAKQMLRSANHSIARVATSVGFGSLRSFERTFKRYTGVTPNAFKRTVRPGS